MKNRSITKILGEWWAALGGDQKTSYIDQSSTPHPPSTNAESHLIIDDSAKLSSPPSGPSMTNDNLVNGNAKEASCAPKAHRALSSLDSKTEGLTSSCRVHNRSIFYLVALWSLIGLAKGGMLTGHNSPPVFDFKREWILHENDAIGSRVVTVTTRDEDHDRITYGLERAKFLDGSNHFTIHSATGEVFLKESLAGKAGSDLYLYVTANDGHQTAKIEIYVRVRAAVKEGDSLSPEGGLVDASSGSSSANRGIPPPGYPSRRPVVIPPFGGGANRSRRPPFSRTTSTSTSSPTSPTTRVRIPLSQMSHPLATSLPPNLTNVTSDSSPSTSEDEKHGNSITLVSDELGPPSISFNMQNNNHLKGNYDESRNNAGGMDLMTAFLPLLAAIAFSPLAGLVFWLLHRRCNTREKRMNLIKSLSNHKKVLGPHTSDISETSMSSISGELDSSGSTLFQKLGGKRSVISNRYESSSPQHSGLPVTGQYLDETGIGRKSSPMALHREVDPQWEFPRHRLRFAGILGEGCFGQVWKCEALLESSEMAADEEHVVVAVKTLKENAHEREKSDLLAEIDLMKRLDEHDNVVSMIGCCTEQEPFFLIMKYVARGKLQSYLRDCRVDNNISSRDLTSFAYQVAKGMSYLSDKGIIHRDLAARNVLIDENKTCKIADFGLARSVVGDQPYEHKSQGRLPIRWMAIESLFDSIFTSKSDVWSFGILMWEIVTLGSTPYPGLSAKEVVSLVKRKERLPKPDHCKPDMYNIMFHCWSEQPVLRPNFTDLVKFLEKLLVSETEYIELERILDSPYYNVIPPGDEEEGEIGEKL